LLPNLKKFQQTHPKNSNSRPKKILTQKCKKQTKSYKKLLKILIIIHICSRITILITFFLLSSHSTKFNEKIIMEFISFGKD